MSEGFDSSIENKDINFYFDLGDSDVNLQVDAERDKLKQVICNML